MINSEGRLRLYPELQAAPPKKDVEYMLSSLSLNKTNPESNSDSDSDSDSETNSSSTPNITDLCAACGATGGKRCTRCRAVCYCSVTCQKSDIPFHKKACKKLKLQNEDENGEVVNNKNPYDNPAKRGKTGLQNLGNTCFMNSALQCLSHARPITTFFLTDKFKDEINADNFMGTGGKLASEYARVVKDLWLGEQRYVNPSGMKMAIGKFNTMFRGMQQHDSQELINFLLDGLHEDLNRIVDKPYVENSDCDGTKLAELGAENWDKYKLRNDSEIIDHTYGQFQSTLVCPVCNNVSVSFDAYGQMILPLPNELVIYVTLFRYKNPSVPGFSSPATPLDAQPVRYGVRVPKSASVAMLKSELAKIGRLGAKANKRLMLAKIEHSSVQCGDWFDDVDPVSKIKNTDVLHAYESHEFRFDANAVHGILQLVRRRSNVDVDEVKVEIEPEPEIEPTPTPDDDDAQFLSYIGSPIFTSVPNTFTCEQLRKHLWMQISFLFDSEKATADMLDVWLVEKEDDLFEKEGGIVLTTTDKLSSSDTSIKLALPKSAQENICPFVIELSDELCKLMREFSVENDKSANDYSDFLEKALEEKKNKEKKEEKKSSSWRSYLGGLGAGGGDDEDSVKTLDEVLENYGETETLDVVNSWKCSKCKVDGEAIKEIKIRRLPNILILGLKRFVWVGNRARKIDTMVEFPLEGLDMSKYCVAYEKGEAEAVGSGPGEVSGIYDLFGVVNHMGQMGFGHYTANARSFDCNNKMGDDWHCFNDSSCTKISAEDVCTSNAYILFYRRRVMT
ncbi:hypothetical protein ScalyP_jg11328 [Parmales sp. scaly parma]|nr:hypothetical protein ScalyP_jg11328 [Parmales sp. scaly parma]